MIAATTQGIERHACPQISDLRRAYFGVCNRSLTCNIAREWQIMMAERRGEVVQGEDRPSDRDPRVSILRQSLQASRPRVRRSA